MSHHHHVPGGVPGLDRPTACMAAPEVVRDIKTLIRENHVLSAADARFARDAGLLPITGVERLSMNDGVIYETADIAGPQLSASTETPSSRLTLASASGKLQCLVLLVDFPDNPGSQTSAHYRNLLFDRANPDSMRNFYKELSYNKLDIDGVVTPWLRAPHPYSHYTNAQSGTGLTYPMNCQGLLEDILKIYTATGSLAGFDANGDGYVDGLFMVHAGPGAEADPVKANRPHKIWSHKWTLPAPFVNSGVKAFAYFTAPEDGQLGVFAHEFGHFLGLPDLYDTSYRSRGVGDWCLMGGGSWGGGGATPTRMSAWCLAERGWIRPKRVRGTIGVTLATLELSPGECYRLDLAGGPRHEYFLVENRQKTGRDIALPGSGLALWHIDRSQSSNSNALSYMVGLVQADGKRDMEFNRNGGDGGDVFPGSKKVTNVDSSALVQPNTIRNNGTPTSVRIGGITTNANRTVSASLTT